VGAKCWEILGPDGAAGRCSSCPKRDLDFNIGKASVREFQDSDGRYYRFISRLIDWPDGTKVHLEQGEEITELKLSIEAMNDMDARMKIMIDSSPLGINFLDEDSNLIDCNLEAMRMFGFGMEDKEEYLARHIEFVPEYQPDGRSSRELRVEYIKEGFEKGSATHEWEYVTKKGEPLPCTVNLIRSTYKGRAVVIVHMQDMRELREAEKLTRLVLDTMPLGATLWNRDRVNLLTNKELTHLLGLTSEEVFVEKFYDLMPEHQPDGRLSEHVVESVLKDALTNG
jgi:PAS domain S-box-containing protein